MAITLTLAQAKRLRDAEVNFKRQVYRYTRLKDTATLAEATALSIDYMNAVNELTNARKVVGAAVEVKLVI